MTKEQLFAGGVRRGWAGGVFMSTSGHFSVKKELEAVGRGDGPRAKD